VVNAFGENGPGFKPGTGNASLTTDIKGKVIASQRDLLREEMLNSVNSTQTCLLFLDMPDNVFY